MRARRAAGCAAALVAMGVVGAAPALAATQTPGILQAKDIPGKFVLAQTPVTFETIEFLKLDAAACTHTATPQVGVTGAVALRFTRTDTKPGPQTVSEAITSYDNVKDAQASFTKSTEDAKAAQKCASVGFIPPGQATVIGPNTIYASQKFPAVGDDSFAARLTSTSGGEPNISVNFRSGTDIVSINIYNGLKSDAIIRSALKDLATTAKRSVQRLPHPTTIPDLAAPRALTVDSATSGCAQLGLKSAASSKKATITFENTTDQTLHVTWLDLDGAIRAYGDVAPDTTRVQETFIGHVWKVADETEQCVQITTVDKANVVVKIKG